jgi:hypothetical protein
MGNLPGIRARICALRVVNAPIKWHLKMKYIAAFDVKDLLPISLQNFQVSQSIITSHVTVQFEYKKKFILAIYNRTTSKLRP